MAFLALFGGITDLGIDPASQYGALDDTVLILAGNNTVYTREGNDTVYTTRSLAATAHNIVLGLGNDTFFGGAGIDRVADNAGNDFCDLGAGGDRVRVGAGNDMYIGGTGNDEIDFQNIYFDDGTSIQNTAFGVIFDLAKTTAQNLGIFGLDTFIGFEYVFGSETHDQLFGNALANQIEGLGGNDTIFGRAGDDQLEGGNGLDILVGNSGRDRITMSETAAARDLIRFLSLSDSTANALTCDRVQQFDKGGLATDDKIDLSAIDANPLAAGNQAFIFKGAGAFTAARGEVRLVVAGADTLVHIDTDTDAAAEMIIRIEGVTGLTAADFIL